MCFIFKYASALARRIIFRNENHVFGMMRPGAGLSQLFLKDNSWWRLEFHSKIDALSVVAILAEFRSIGENC